MKVLLFIPQLDRGGPDRVFSELAIHLPAAGVQTSLLVQAAGGHYWQQLPAGLEKHVLLPSDMQQATKTYPVRAFADHVLAARPDVVLCTLRSLLTASAAAFLRQLEVPLVIRPANHLTRNGMELLRQSPAKHSLSWLANIATLHIATQVICQSQDLYRDFRRYGVSAKRLTVIGNPIELPSESQQQSLSANRLAGSPSLVAVGRLMPQKGFDVLIEAVGLLRQSLPHLRLHLYGEGPDRALLEQQIRRLDLGDRVILAGFSAEVERPIAGADFLVSSSRYEGFPNVVLEALSWGTPVVATDCLGGTNELVVEGQTGWLCKPDSAESLAGAILKAVSAQRPSPAALRSFVEARYATPRIVQAYADVLQRAVATP